ncbi:penicillin-binding transpeptidase domain-containing protein [Vitiosangium sp. GDMCC 1.1324]|uniref:penicillin-binding transpeptidase domain-containing protein n=1 Tax=Vitiosangium sp. (strain GDMCC 1.1324) TaxID=2138576 RepID=UPI000D34E2FE|nr:penicillin-binding transpeptidase domain-containing protein [Vitiosangium sp. GDMCC 1.1324]PTL75898.1 penicillin-binding protein [Vitiosangium sp. GDMCC 1.1324]
MTLSRALPATLILPLLFLLVGADEGTTLDGGTAPLAEAALPDAGTPDSQVAEAAGAEAAGGTDAGVMLGLVPPVPVPSREQDPPMSHLRSLSAKQDVLARARKNAQGRLVVPGPKGDVPLTIDPTLQSQLTNILTEYRVPYGAAVVLEPSTGRVLAMAEHSQAQPGLRGLATRAAFPAASVFKIITGSALLEAGVTPMAETCFHGGKRRLSEKLLEDSARDSQCHSLAEAMGKSANVIFAKLTHRYLSPDALKRAAARFHFNREISFPVPMDVSLASVPEGDAFRFAQTGAGFGDVYLSPLHGALLACVAANKGVWKDPILFEPDPNAPPPPGEQVLSPEVARDLTTLMEATVTKGTAHRIFRERGMGVPGAVGKTGTLADRSPFRDYSWFVGFAPKDNPKVAVAALIVNDPIWRIRATWLGREAMRLGLARLPPGSLAPVKDEATPPVEESPAEEESSEEEPSSEEVAGTPAAPGTKAAMTQP